MTDRELLELAAKAAKIKKDDSPYNGGGFGNDGFDCTGDMMLDWHNNKRWNPLTDDGDALRLAVKLLFEIDMGRGCIAIRHSTGIKILEAFNHDPLTATRRAIVRAAAEIGRQND